MTSVFVMLTVTASAEQMPSTCSAIGLFSKTGLKRTSLALDMAQALPPRMLFRYGP